MSICPKGLRCEFRHDYNNTNLKDPRTSQAFDIIFTYLYDNRTEQSNIIKELKEIKSIIKSSKTLVNHNKSNISQDQKSNSNLLNKLISIDDRLNRIEGSIRNKGLPLRASDLSFNHPNLKFKHSDSSILGRGEAIAGKTILQNRGAATTFKIKKISKHDSKQVQRGRVVKKSAEFIVTSQKEHHDKIKNKTVAKMKKNSADQSSKNISDHLLRTTTPKSSISKDSDTSISLISPKSPKSESKKSILSSLASKISRSGGND